MAAVPPPPETDDTLDRLRAMLPGDNTAGDDMFMKFYLWALSVLRRLCRDEHEAQDRAQDTLLRLWVFFRKKGEPPEGLSERGGLRAYVSKSARFTYLDSVRRPRNNIQLIDPIVLAKWAVGKTTPLDDIEMKELGAEIYSFLSTLSQSDRRICELKMFARYSDAHIGKELGSPTKTIWNRRDAIRKRARQFFRNHPEWFQVVQRALGFCQLRRASRQEER